MVILLKKKFGPNVIYYVFVIEYFKPYIVKNVANEYFKAYIVKNVANEYFKPYIVKNVAKEYFKPYIVKKNDQMAPRPRLLLISKFGARGSWIGCCAGWAFYHWGEFCRWVGFLPQGEVGG